MARVGGGERVAPRSDWKGALLHLSNSQGQLDYWMTGCFMIG